MSRRRVLRGLTAVGALVGAMVGGVPSAGAVNPIIPDRFVADPSAHVFNGRVHLYLTDDETNSGTYWDSKSWRSYSSANLVDWTDHGDVFSISGFSWARQYAWAPGAAERGGRFYLYLPVDRTKIGVAVASSPVGPFTDARGSALVDRARDANTGEEPIDPMIFTDDDGSSYLYFGTRTPKVVKLGADMVSTSGAIADVGLTGATKYGEAPHLHKIGSTYYFSYSTGWPGQIHYATGTSPLGPFTYRGVLLDYTNISTNHHSLFQYQGQWYVAYHRNAREGGGSLKRSVAMDRVVHNADGTITTVKQTVGGVGPFATFTAQHSGLRLDASGTDVRQAAASSSESQHWQLRAKPGGYVEVLNRATGSCLDVSGSSTANGANVLQWQCTGAQNQQWTVRTVDTTTVSLVNRVSGKCLDVPSSNTAAGTRLIQWTCSGGANQRWTRAAA
ncbi:RICIN domain-containing protein [Nocardia sp. NRRL S-836]|uniref:RICIN domain-containing protein n=1 Tax=Nocardia sp. NRRL S-836 TaxID=1519492 RepID=UPI0007C80596|nr:RICIN domain-containing protein [Nocardia sp. NRRL S-836]